jgi:hypothetical protein
MTIPPTPTGTDQAVALGLPGAGYIDQGETYPWDAPAATLVDDPDVDVAGLTVFEYLTDQAGAQSMGLVEYLEATGGGPDEDEDHGSMWEDNYW